MRLSPILRILFPVFFAAHLFAAPANIQVDTKTHAISITDGSAIIDAKGITLTLGGFTIYDGAGVKTIITGSTSGVMFGATGNKIGFLGTTPITRPIGTTDLRQALINLGLYSGGGASPLNLNGGAFASGPLSSTTGAFSSTLTVTGNSTFGGTLGISGALTGGTATFTNFSAGTFSATNSAVNLSSVSGSVALFNIIRGSNLGQNWINSGSDADHLTNFIGLIDAGPGAVWDTTPSRGPDIWANPATSAKPFSPASVFIEGQYWNGSASVLKGTELETKINTLGDAEFWIELPIGSPLFIFTRDPSTGHAQLQTANQPGNTLEFRAEDLGGGYQRVAYISHYGLFADQNFGYTGTVAAQSDYLKIGGIGTLGNATGSSYNIIRNFDAVNLFSLTGAGDLTILGTFTASNSSLDFFSFTPQGVAQTNVIRMGSTATLGAAQASLVNTVRSFDSVVVESLNGSGDLSVLGTVSVGGTSAKWISGTAASPEGLVTASPGSIFTSTAGGAGTTLWVKQSGTGNTGWVGK